MQRACRLSLGLALVILFALAPHASVTHAKTMINVHGQFVESSAKRAGCSADFCGTGFLLPLGKATDSGSRSTNLKTFTFVDGSITTTSSFPNA